MLTASVQPQPFGDFALSPEAPLPRTTLPLTTDICRDHTIKNNFILYADLDENGWISKYQRWYQKKSFYI